MNDIITKEIKQFKSDISLVERNKCYTALEVYSKYNKLSKNYNPLKQETDIFLFEYKIIPKKTFA